MPPPHPAARPTRRIGAALAAAALLTAGCSTQAPVAQAPSAAAPTAPPSGTVAGSSTPGPTSPTGPTGPTGESSPTPTRTALPGVEVAQTLARDLDVPWGVAVAADGTAYLAERGTARVLRRSPDGTLTTLGEVPGVRASGEGGLLGLALDPADGTLLAYFTTSRDNRVARIPLSGNGLGAPQPILTGIASGRTHNGGRLLVAADGTLFVGTGDAGDRATSQDRSSLGGKILRITTTGAVPADNPIPGSPVWSWGHRNVQGLAQDSAGRLWATEFGQNTWDELNLVGRGGDHGWPDVEGPGSQDGSVAPQAVWRTDDASPSGLAIVDDVAYVAALKGRRLWQVDVSGGQAGTPKAWFTGDLGRLRTVLAGPGGLWLTTSNTDGRGDPGRTDDRLLLLTLR